ncbi:MAG: cytochrome c maturation protein CcmE [Rickettsiales bacterium]|nr:cytochrome c maturation protein CcmE [Rickettsiales bacterium]
MKPKHQRLIFISISLVFLLGATLLILQAFRENLVFFYAPSDLQEKHPAAHEIIRMGGLVKEGTLKHGTDNHIQFELTDGNASVVVTYQGMLPSLFREGQGVVAEGRLTTAKQFTATRILTKHEEKYMPKEVVDALKKSGQWKENAR